MHLEQLIADGAVEFGHTAVRSQFHLLEKNRARQRVTVRVQSAGSDANDGVAGSDGFAVEYPRSVHHTDDRAAQVIFAGLIEPGHLRGLPANQRATVLRAGFHEAFDDLSKDARLQSARPEVIEKEERLRAQHRNVVHTMIDEVLADGVVPIHRESDLQFGADAIDARNEHRLPVFLRVEREQTAEAAHFAEHFTAPGGSQQMRQSGLDAIAQVDIDARAGVSFLFHRQNPAGLFADQRGTVES